MESTFNKGEHVPESGEYVCAPCGFKRQYSKGEAFAECTSCFSGTPDGHEDFADGLELWEKVRNLPEPEKQ